MSSHSSIGRKRSEYYFNGEQMKRQRSAEWHSRHGYSSSDEEYQNNPPGAFDTQLLASLLIQSQQLADIDKSYRSDCDNEDVTESLLCHPIQQNKQFQQNAANNVITSPITVVAKTTNSKNPFHLKYEVHQPSEADRLSYSGSSTFLDRLQSSAAELTSSNSAYLCGTLNSGYGVRSSHSKNGRLNRLGGMTSSSSATSSNSNQLVGNRERDRQKLIQLQKELQTAAESATENERNCDSFVDQSGKTSISSDPTPPEVPPRTQSLLMSIRKKSDYQLKIAENGDQKHEEFIPQNKQKEYLMADNSREFQNKSVESSESASQQGLGAVPLQSGGGPQQISQNMSQGNTLGGQHCQQLSGSTPLVISGFPLRTSHSAHAPHYSPYSPSRFHIDKRCQHRCSWKCLSIALILLTVVLAAMLAYFATISSIKPNMDSSNCILVQDVKSIPLDQQQQQIAGSTLIPTEDTVQTSTSDHQSTFTTGIGNNAVGSTSPQLPQQQPQQQLLQNQQQQQQQVLQQQQQQQPHQQLSTSQLQDQSFNPQKQQLKWPQVVELKDMNEMYPATIPPHQFWNLEFRNKHPAFIRFNFTLPWGANFAVYGRRNVAPSVTQYDFVEFIKGGRLDSRIKKRRRRRRRRRDIASYMNLNDDEIKYFDILADSNNNDDNNDNRNQKEKQLDNNKINYFNEMMHDNEEREMERDNLRGNAFNFKFNQNKHNKIIVENNNNDDDIDDDNDGIVPTDRTTEKLEKFNNPMLEEYENNNSLNHVFLSSSPQHQQEDINENNNDNNNFDDDDNNDDPDDIEENDDDNDDDEDVENVSSSSSSHKNNNRNENKKKYFHVISKRSSSSDGLSTLDMDTMMVNVSMLQYLDTGLWFFSVYNDELLAHTITLIVEEAEGVSTSCPNDCSGRGSCYLGKCDCIDGYQGVDCSKSVCPVLCSGHGHYGGGVCHCEEGWKGAECDIPIGECEVPTCTNHGRCIEGECHCERGWKGPFCDQHDCIDPSCSGHGTCVSGQCYCKAGWQGEDCGTVDQQVYQCLPGCSEHGTYDLETGQCVCERHWTGPDCSQAVCSLDCGPNGICESGKCRCKAGWTGNLCDQLPCDIRCSEHGQCKNGTCVCSQGWNGRHCTLPGCENGCSRHGQCTLEEGEYHCNCIEGWAGSDCSIELELDCKDNIDNDHDGMTDCSDSECCSHPACSEHIMCLSSNDPVEVLLRKQPPSVTASFYQRVKFLIEENSVQSYAHMDEYSENLFWSSFIPGRVSVMRGQVITPQGLGIIGIRVSVDRESRFGFTLTRQGGWFDVLVNGGGAVTLQFQRSPFRPLTRTVFVPWNRIVVLPPVQMPLTSDDDENSPTHIKLHTLNPALTFLYSILYHFSNEAPNSGSLCMDHDHEQLKPQLISTWMPNSIGAMPGKRVIFAETQIVQESIQIPGSELYLTYQSSQASGYLSIVRMRLTSEKIPKTLTHIHVGVEIEGSLHVKTYEADPNLIHTFAWNKRNVYRQKVYGITIARISIGYQHSNCDQPVWSTQTAKLQGFDVDISDIGGWGLDIHHHYNFHEGILQKGDGSTLHMKLYPRIVKPIMGTGIQRPLNCPDHCNGIARESSLLTPIALASGPDGSLYVGDFNLVRRIKPDGKVFTILQLGTTQVSYQYYLAVSPADGHLYISDPEKHQILRLIKLDNIKDPVSNSEPVVGSGLRCIPGDEGNCGDGGLASQARLSHPKGIAIAADRTMYIADGTNIRAVDPKNIIHTLIGHHGHHNHWSPAPCFGTVMANQAQLQWPTGLALSPLDGSLHFIDDRLVLKLTADMKIRVVAGTPLHCNNSPDKNKTVENVLGTVLALAFSPFGDLYIADSDSRRVNSIRIVDTASNMKYFAGKQENIGSLACDCDSNLTTSSPKYHYTTTVNPIRGRYLGEKSAQIFDSLHYNNGGCTCESIATTIKPTLSSKENKSRAKSEILISSNAKFQAISAIAVAQDGVINVADQGSMYILSLEHYLPSHDDNGEFHIPYPPTNEVYVFNRYGQHVTTKDLTSGKTRYSFLYSKNTSFGRLSTVTDSSGNKIQFLRDYSNVVSSIENTQDHKSEVQINGIGIMTKLTEKGKLDIELDYDSNTGLLNSRSSGGETYIYQYDEFGRVTSMILPSGESVRITSKLAKTEGLSIYVYASIESLFSRELGKINELLVLGSVTETQIKRGNENAFALIKPNSTIVIHDSSGIEIESSAIARHPILESSLLIEAEMFPMWSHQSVVMAPGLTNNMHSVYNLIGDGRNPQQALSREIWINQTRIFGVEYDQFTSRETFYDINRTPILVVAYDPAGLPKSYYPTNGYPVNITYDRFNRIDGWKWGPSELKYTYDRHGLLSEITSQQDGIISYIYNDWNLVSEIGLASQRKFILNYDESGGLRQVILPSGTKHLFSMQTSIGFIRKTYTPPGSSKPYLQHYSHSGALLQTIFPGDGARIVYRYNSAGLLAEIVHGGGKSEFSYNEITGMPSTVTHTERELEYRWDFEFAGALLTEERIDYVAKTGLSNAKFTYDYDSNFRVISIQGRIGGQSLSNQIFAFDGNTGQLSQIGQFKIIHPQLNQTQVFDGTASFTRTIDGRYLESELSLTIHRMEVFRMEFSFGIHGRITQTRTYTRNVAVNTYTNVKNYTWDCDGQLIGVEAQEPWGFRYDDNGNLLSLTYRGNTIPMEYNTLDRIVKFGEGQYKYDGRGFVAQNAREERFHYNTQGLLVRASRRGRFDIKYYYDHLKRLTTRKDNFGNVTQFFYNNQELPYQISQIYSPRDGKLMSLTYDDRGHLIYAQVYRNKYYIATDQSGTPIMIFNQYGEGIREIMRSPFGHIVYDSNPYLFMPIDFCGGILDQVTTLVHYAEGQVYDPLIGQWMTPNWENVEDRVMTPTKMHLYRFNGNDPINIDHDRNYPKNFASWMGKIGINIKNLMPQLGKPLWKQPALWGRTMKNPVTFNLKRPTDEMSSMSIESGFLAQLSIRRIYNFEQLTASPRSSLKFDVMNPKPQKLGADADPPFGKGIIVSRTIDGQAIVSSVPAANAIYRDVYTSVFNRSKLLPFTFVVHNAQQDAFYFVKEDAWRASEDRQQLKRLQGQVNTTFHEITRENGSGNNYLDVKIHGVHAIINLRYGTTVEKEKQRLMHHAKLTAVRKAWHREKEALRNGLTTNTEWSQPEIDEILKQGYVNLYEGDYIHDVNEYPELAEDPYNIRFTKKKTSSIRKRRRRSSSSSYSVLELNNNYYNNNFNLENVHEAHKLPLSLSSQNLYKFNKCLDDNAC